MSNGIGRVRVLHVEDSADDAALIFEALASSGFDVKTFRVENAAEMEKALRDQSWDAVLSDYNLPEFSAEGALELLKSKNLDIPFIVVSGCIGEEVAVSLMRAGAHDVVMKDNLSRLGPALKRELSEAEIRIEKGRMAAEIERWAEVCRDAQWGIAVMSGDGKVFEYMNPEFARMYGYTEEELRGAELAEFFPSGCCTIPEGKCCSGSWEDYHIRKDCSIFPVLINVTEVKDGSGEVLYSVVNVQDITRLKEVEKALKESEARFSAMTNNVPGMVFRYLMEGSSGKFSFVSEGAVAVCGLSPEEMKSDPERFRSLFHEADWKSFIMSRHASSEGMTTWNWEGRMLTPEGSDKWVNLRATPSRLEDGSLLWDGVMFNITESKQKEEEIRWSRERLRQLSAHQDAGREDERRRIAREIHDELGQALTALKIDLDWLSGHVGREGRVAERMDSMSRILIKTVESVRRIAEDLRPGMLDDLGLAAAIEWQVEQFKDRTGIDCRLDMNRDEFELEDRHATCIFRVVQEALTNVARHSGADEVSVKLAEDDGGIALEVADNGKGFQDEARKRSFGLLGIRERVNMLGGKVEISSEPGCGTSVRASIPLALKQ